MTLIYPSDVTAFPLPARSPVILENSAPMCFILTQLPDLYVLSHPKSWGYVYQHMLWGTQPTHNKQLLQACVLAVELETWWCWPHKGLLFSPRTFSCKMLSCLVWSQGTHLSLPLPPCQQDALEVLWSPSIQSPQNHLGEGCWPVTFWLSEACCPE